MVVINIYLFSSSQQDIFQGSSSTKNTTGNITLRKHRHKKPTEKDRDQYLFETLKCAPQDDYTLICLDKMITHCNPTQLYDCLEYAICHICFDIFYLASWADRCDLYSDFHEICHYKIVKTQSPHGTSCLLFSPAGRKKFLDTVQLIPGKTIDLCLNPQLGKFSVYSTTPSLIEFDITQRETDLEYIKVCKCREVPESVRPVEICRRNTTTLNLLWFVLILIIIICITGILLSYADKTVKLENYSPSNLVYPINIQPPYNPLGDLNSYFG